MILISEINVTRDIFDLKLFVNSGENLEDLDYEVHLEEWTSLNMTMKINFTKPALISRGYQLDVLSLIVKNKTHFVSVY